MNMLSAFHLFRLPLLAAVAVLVSALVPGIAAAANRVYWVGKDPDGCRYSFRNTAGEVWIETLTFKGKTNSGHHTEVTRTEDFVELRLDGTKPLRTRIYKDRILFLSNSTGRWSEMAKGEWID
jgi:hypothetical protein